MYRTVARDLFMGLLERPLVRLLLWLRLSPNHLTLLGLALAGGSAYLIGTGHFVSGGLVLLASGFFDLLDGMLARATGKATPFGAVLDSVADRLGEAAVLLGVLAFYLSPLSEPEVILAYLALTASIMVSYLRARAEALGLQASEGIMTRPERVAILAVGLFTGWVDVALGVMASLAFLTVGQRLWLVWRGTRG